MAHKKGVGTTSLGRESESKRLGIKIYGGQPANAGQIIVRQRGTKYRPGVNVRIAGDDTLYAAVNGLVQFSKRSVRTFTGALKKATIISIKAAK